MAHALLSPSSASRWMNCPGSIALEQGYPNTTSKFSSEGTAAHELAEMCLTQRLDADAFIGRIITADGIDFEVDEDMAAHVQFYVDRVREYADGHELLVEQRVDFSAVVTVPESFGTSDAIIITADGAELMIVDLKFGRGVKVDAEENSQLQIYALGALDQFGMVYDFERVRMVIVQPRLGHVSEWDCTVEELLRFGEEVKTAAIVAKSYVDLGADKLLPAAFKPSEKACRWCKAKAACPSLDKTVFEGVAPSVDDLADLTEEAVQTAIDDLPKVFSLSLSRKMELVDLVEDWCKAVRARVESELLSGRKVDGYKLVEGRAGSRAWSSKAEAEEALKAMRLKAEDMYDWTLISPTTAEKLAKAGTIGPRQWPKLQNLITRAPGKPSVAPLSDKRPELNPASDLQDLNDLA